MRFALITAVLALSVSAVHADPLNCSLAGDKAAAGLTAAVADDTLAVTWNGDHNTELRLRFAIEGGPPTIHGVEVRGRGGQWTTLASHLTPEYRVVSGVRRISEQQLGPLRTWTVTPEMIQRDKWHPLPAITPEFIEKEKWNPFWDAPLFVPGIHEGRAATNPGLLEFVDKSSTVSGRREMRRELIVPLVMTLVVVLGVASSATAQRTTATFAGIVTDTSGGVLPGADVTLTNEGTGIVERQVTSTSGEFIFNYVPGGTYTLTVSIPGFKTRTATGITLGAAQSVRRTFELEVGEMAENITVSGAAPLINTVSTEQRINLEPLEVRTLPAANRNLTNLLNLGTGLTRQEGVVEGGGSGSGGAGGIRLRLNGLGGAAMSITANGTDASANAGADSSRATRWSSSSRA